MSPEEQNALKWGVRLTAWGVGACVGGWIVAPIAGLVADFITDGIIDVVGEKVVEDVVEKKVVDIVSGLSNSAGTYFTKEYTKKELEELLRQRELWDS